MPCRGQARVRCKQWRIVLFAGFSGEARQILAVRAHRYPHRLEAELRASVHATRLDAGGYDSPTRRVRRVAATRPNDMEPATVAALALASERPLRRYGPLLSVPTSRTPTQLSL